MWADAIIAVLQSPAALGIAVPIVELVLRMTKTTKPVSLLTPIKYACVSIATALNWVGVVLDVVITTANNVKPPEIKAP